MTGRSRRHGVSVFETVIAIGILGVVLTVLTQVAAWNLRERLHVSARQAALDLAANTLEKARARDWEAITAAWAAEQTLPDDHELLLPEGRLLVTVTAAKDTALLKRVAVVVRYTPQVGLPEQSVELVTLIAPRASRAAGGKS